MAAPARARPPGDLEPFAGRWLPPEWPLVFMLAGYPVWWFLGAGALIWPLFSLPMLGRLVMRRRTVRVPRGFGWWLLFLVWMLLSFIAAPGRRPVAVPLAGRQLLLGHRHVRLRLQRAA